MIKAIKFVKMGRIKEAEKAIRPAVNALINVFATVADKLIMLAVISTAVLSIPPSSDAIPSKSTYKIFKGLRLDIKALPHPTVALSKFFTFEFIPPNVFPKNFKVFDLFRMLKLSLMILKVLK